MKIDVKRALKGGTLILLMTLSFVLVSHTSIGVPMPDESRLVFAFRNATKNEVHCRKSTPEELEKMLPHMRREQICERARNDTLVIVSIDGQKRFEKVFHPLGFRSDGYTLGLENFGLSSGSHDVVIRLEEGGAPPQVSEFKQSMSIEKDHTYLIEFQSGQGFKVHGEGAI